MGGRPSRDEGGGRSSSRGVVASEPSALNPPPNAGYVTQSALPSLPPSFPPSLSLSCSTLSSFSLPDIDMQNAKAGPSKETDLQRELPASLRVRSPPSPPTLPSPRRPFAPSDLSLSELNHLLYLLSAYPPRLLQQRSLRTHNPLHPPSPPVRRPSINLRLKALLQDRRPLQPTPPFLQRRAQSESEDPPRFRLHPSQDGRSPLPFRRQAEGRLARPSERSPVRTTERAERFVGGVHGRPPRTHLADDAQARQEQPARRQPRVVPPKDRQGGVCRVHTQRYVPPPIIRSTFRGIR